MVLSARALFYCASGIFQTSALFFVTDVVTLDGAEPLRVAGMAAVTMVSVAILAAAPIGKLAARVGSVPCVVASTLIITVLVCALTFVRHIASLLVFATIFGLAVCLFSVADLALVVQTLPNDETSGNDMGIWNLFQYLGTAIGASVSGAVLSMYPADEPLAPTHIAADTPPSLPPVTMAVLGAAERAAHCDSSSCTAPLRDRYAIEGCACAAPPNPAVWRP